MKSHPKGIVMRGKKNWRKVNVDDVEKFLELRRLEERTGGFRYLKKDEELFFIDQAAGQPKRKHLREPSFEDITASLKCFIPLQNTSTFKPFSCSSRNNSSSSRRQQIIEDRLLKSRGEKLSIGEAERQNDPDFYDLWSPQDIELTSNEKAIKKLKTSCVSAPVSLHPPIEAPHPGSSYNPLEDDHADLLEIAYEEELNKQIADEKLMKKLSLVNAINSKHRNERILLEEVNEEMLSDGFEDLPAPRDDDSDDNDKVINTQTKKPRTKKQKEKLKKMKMEERRKLREKSLRIKQDEINRLRAIKKELYQYEQTLVERHRRRLLKRQRMLAMPKRLGTVRYESPVKDVKLPSEIDKSLRKLEPEGNILLERYKSFQKRNIVEPRNRFKPIKRRRKNHKLVLKRSVREITV